MTLRDAHDSAPRIGAIEGAVEVAPWYETGIAEKDVSGRTRSQIVRPQKRPASELFQEHLERALRGDAKQLAALAT